jgi:oleate hydratase
LATLILPPDTTVTSLSYADSQHITVEDIHITEAGSTGIIHVHDNDIVLVTLGSMTASSSLGTNTTAPSSPPSTDPSWTLWESLSHDNALFGNPSNFSTRVPESQWESFTVTLNSPELVDRIAAWTQNAPGTGALMTLKDSNWLMSIVVPHQPHFIDQPADIQVFWGFGLHPTRKGNFVNKPMSECSGAEILTEFLLHMEFPTHPILDHAITIPCLMPYITSQFLTRAPGDRPEVIPHGSTNLAFMGQFVEIPRDVVFTVEYSVRGAQMAVSGLMGLGKQPPAVYKGEHDVKVLAQALKVMIEDGPASEN